MALPTGAESPDKGSNNATFTEFTVAGMVPLDVTSCTGATSGGACGMCAAICCGLSRDDGEQEDNNKRLKAQANKECFIREIGTL